MTIGIMQPYIFPYIGYFQLISAVDKFVLYDDVMFIKQGWINRNRILLNGEPHVFTVPLKNASSFTAIAQTGINQQLYPGWKTKFFKTLSQAYAKAPQYTRVIELLEEVFYGPWQTIGELASGSVTATCRYLGITTPFVPTAIHYGNSDLKAEERVIDICRREGASVYINAAGGKELYSEDHFSRAGLGLRFIKSGSIVYPQFSATFVPWLSIIDVLMFNTPEDALRLINQYELE
jgi:WbqC-like protein family